MERPRSDMNEPEDDTALLEPGDITAALGLLSRLPVQVDTPDATRRGAAAAWAWPLAGAVLGVLAGLVTWVAMGLGLPAPLAAALALATLAVATGAMHEDGLADSADGLWGGWDRARRLEIMRDSRIGTYGVIALVLSLVARWAALSALFQAGAVFGPLIAVGAVSRAPMVALMAWLPNARGDGLSSTVGRPGRDTALAAIATALLIGLIFAGGAVLFAAIWAGLATLACGAVARAKLGGQTGDILGASQQLAEIAALAVLAAML